MLFSSLAWRRLIGRQWHTFAHYFVTQGGAKGSSLHKTENDLWVAYSRWPDRATRDALWIDQTGLPASIQIAAKTLKDCIAISLPEICMQMMDTVLPEATDP